VNQEIFCIRRDEVNLQSILYDGTLIRHGELWSAFPRELVRNPFGAESIIFEIVRPGGIARPSPWKIGLQAIRLRNLSLTLMPGIAIGLNGLLLQWEPSFEVGILAILGAVFFQISVYALNDVEDHIRLIDLPGGQGGSGVIQKGWVSARQLRLFGYFNLLLGLACGIPAVIQRPQILLWVGAVGVLGVLAYSNRPIGMKYRALGGFLIFALVGPLLALGYSLAIFGHYDLSVLLIGMFFGFFAFAVSHTKNLQNIEIDRSLGVHTLATQMDFKKGRHFLVALYFLAYVTLGAGSLFGVLPQVFILPILGIGLPLLARDLRKIYKASGPVSALLVSSVAEASRLYLYHGLLIWIGLILSLVSI
jgi:1,4-dihydroxy-2-naphthoate octaprenyltransferase